jgi:chromosome segregation ATPase
LGLFGNKKSRDDVIAEGVANAALEAEAASAGADKKEESFNSGNAKVDMEITKIKAQLESYGEVRKANSERFTRTSEQMGELRGMIMDINKTMSKIEVSATKAIDLVESVQPEKLMIEIRKQEGKMESLKANIESNEAMMKDIMEEMKKMRTQMNFYKGIEQVIKLNDEVKAEILEIKKVEATIERHADKGETIFLDLEKKMASFEQFERKISEVDELFHGIQGDFDKMKMQINSKAEKKEFLNLMDKFTDFEKHTGDVLKLLDERSKHLKQEVKDSFERIKMQLQRKHGIAIQELPKPPKKIIEGEEKKESTEQNKTIESKQEISAEKTNSSSTTESKTENNEKKSYFAKIGDALKNRKIISKKLSDEPIEKINNEAPLTAPKAPETNEENKTEG